MAVFIPFYLLMRSVFTFPFSGEEGCVCVEELGMEGHFVTSVDCDVTPLDMEGGAYIMSAKC